MWKKTSILTLSAVALATHGYFIEAEKEDGIYQSGETVRFKVTDRAKGEKLSYVVNYGEGESEPVELTGEVIECKLDRPGFILVKLFKSSEKNPNKFIPAGAAVDPEKIVSGTPLPKDFHSFWDQLVADQRQKKLEVLELKQIESQKTIKVFSVKLRRGDLESTGFLAMPADAAPEKKYPGLLFFGGASWVNADIKIAISRAKWGSIAYQPDFHAFEPLTALPREVRDERREKVMDYKYSHVTDRNLYPMKNIFLRTLLAVDFIASLPEINPQKLIAMGGSLGGAQAIAAAALAPDRVTYCIATVPAMSDHFGAKEKHLPGWPDLLATKPEAVVIAPYFDTVNLLKRVKAPVVLSAGFVDVAVPPASVYAAYNSFAGDKKLVAVKLAGHGANIKVPKGPNAITGGGRDLQNYLKAGEKGKAE